MKKRFITIILLLIIVSFLTFLFRNDLLFRTDTVRAFGELTVDFGVPAGDPIFTINNAVPGNSATRDVNVTNGGTIARMVSIKGIKTSSVGNDPKLETVLDIVIKDGTNILYGTGSPTGSRTVADFFTESSNPDGAQLNVVDSGNSKDYAFIVTFPTNAGNEFQSKSVVFDLTFGIITSDNLIINEVYYKVDSDHGLDSPKDRGILGVNGNNVSLIVQGNGANSVNKIRINQKQACNIIQSNNTTIIKGVNVVSNTGNNTSSNNTGSSSIRTRSVQSIINIFNGGSINVANACGQKLGQNDEWVEIFNPTDQDISLKNWSLSDNAGNVKINVNKKIKAGGFALLSKSASTWNFWNENRRAAKIQLGSQIGDGLDNSGDHLILYSPANSEIDRTSWGIDTSGFTPPASNPEAPLGSSTNRIAPGLDTGTVNDWSENTNPNSGN